MKPDNNRPAGTRSATGVAQPMTGNGCGMGMKHLLPVMPFEQSGTLRQTAAASAEAATPGSPLGEPTCTLPTKSESVVVGYYALKKRVSSGASVRKMKREKEVKRWQETTERTGPA